MRNAPVRLTSSVRCQTSASRRSARSSWPTSCIAALATTTSRPPERADGARRRAARPRPRRRRRRRAPARAPASRSAASSARGVDVEQRDARALASEALGGRPPDPAGRAGDERALAVQAPHAPTVTGAVVALESVRAAMTSPIALRPHVPATRRDSGALRRELGQLGDRSRSRSASWRRRSRCRSPASQPPGCSAAPRRSPTSWRRSASASSPTASPGCRPSSPRRLGLRVRRRGARAARRLRRRLGAARHLPRLPGRVDLGDRGLRRRRSCASTGIAAHAPWLPLALAGWALSWLLASRDIRTTARIAAALRGRLGRADPRAHRRSSSASSRSGGAPRRARPQPRRRPPAPGDVAVDDRAGRDAFGFLSFAGFESAGSLGEESTDPRRTIPRSMVAAIAFGGGLLRRLHGRCRRSASAPTRPACEAFAASAAPLGELARATSATGWPTCSTSAAIVSAIGAGLGCASVAARMLFALGRDRLLGERAGRGVRATGAPAGGLAFVHGARPRRSSSSSERAGTTPLDVVLLLRDDRDPQPAGDVRAHQRRRPRASWPRVARAPSWLCPWPGSRSPATCSTTTSGRCPTPRSTSSPTSWRAGWCSAWGSIGLASPSCGASPTRRARDLNATEHRFPGQPGATSHLRRAPASGFQPIAAYGRRPTARPPPWSTSTVRSTGCACPTTTPPSLFARLLDPNAGHWSIAPAPRVHLRAPLPARHARHRDDLHHGHRQRPRDSMRWPSRLVSAGTTSGGDAPDEVLREVQGISGERRARRSSRAAARAPARPAPDPPGGRRWRAPSAGPTIASVSLRRPRLEIATRRMRATPHRPPRASAWASRCAGSRPRAAMPEPRVPDEVAGRIDDSVEALALLGGRARPLPRPAPRAGHAQLARPPRA